MKEEESNINNSRIDETTDLFSFIDDSNSKTPNLDGDSTFEEPLDIDEELKNIRDYGVYRVNPLPINEKYSSDLNKKITRYNRGTEDTSEIVGEEDNIEYNLDSPVVTRRSGSNKSNKRNIKEKTQKSNTGKSKKVLKIVSFISVFLILISVIGFQFSLLLSTYKEDEKVDNLPVDLPLLNDGGKKDTEEEFKEPIEVEDTLDLEVNEVTGLLNRSGVYKKDLEDSLVFKIGLVTEEGFSLPVSVVINESKIKEDFSVSNMDEVSQYDLYMRYGKSVLYNTLGFTSYHPYSGDLIEFDSDEDKKTDLLIFRMTEGSTSLYDEGTASSNILKSSLVDTFSGHYSRIKFEDSDGNDYYFSHEGEGSEVLELTTDLDNFSYYLYKTSNGNSYIGNNFGKTYESVIEALEDMKTAPNDLYSSLIPEGVDYTVELEGEIVKVNFTEELDLTQFSSKVMLGMIEGLNLTANGFDKTLKLSNIKQSVWQGFSFVGGLEKPVGANKIILK